MSSSSSSTDSTNIEKTSKTTMTTTEINVPMHIVWEYLSDLERWDEWNPEVRFNHSDVESFFSLIDQRKLQSQEQQDKSQSSSPSIRCHHGKAKLARVTKRKEWNTSLPSFKGRKFDDSDDKKHNSSSSSSSSSKRHTNTTTWSVVDCTIHCVNRQDLIVSWTTYEGKYQNTTVMQLLPVGHTGTMLKHTQTLERRSSSSSNGSSMSMSKLNSMFAGMLGGPRGRGGSRSNRSLVTNSICVDQSLKTHVECHYFRTLLTDLSTSLPQQRQQQQDQEPSSIFSTPSDYHNQSSNHHHHHHVHFDSSSVTMKTDQSSSSSDFWSTPEQIRKAVITRFVEDAVDIPDPSNIIENTANNNSNNDDDDCDNNHSTKRVRIVITDDDDNNDNVDSY